MKSKLKIIVRKFFIFTDVIAILFFRSVNFKSTLVHRQQVILMLLTCNWCNWCDHACVSNFDCFCLSFLYIYFLSFLSIFIFSFFFQFIFILFWYLFLFRDQLFLIRLFLIFTQFQFFGNRNFIFLNKIL